MPKLTKAEALQFLDRHADVLAAPGNPCNPYGTREWLENFVAEVVPQDGFVLFPEATLGGRTIGFLLPDPAHPSRCQGLSNFYTSLYAPVASDAADRPAALQALARALVQERPRLAMLNMAPLDAECSDVTGLEQALSEEGWYVRRYASFGNRHHPCTGLGYEQYLASRDSKLRNTVERKSKKFLSGGGTLEIVTRLDEVDAAMDEYEAIYTKSWKRPEPYPGFARGWARRCAQRGWLRLGVARLGGVAVAAQIWYVHGGTGYIYKLVYDEAHAKTSAGTVLTAHLLRHVLDVDHVDAIDFLSGDDPYKATWMDHVRGRIGLVACNLRSAEGLMLAARELAGQATAPWRARRKRKSWGRHADTPA